MDQIQLSGPSSVHLGDFPFDVLHQRTSWWDGIDGSSPSKLYDVRQVTGLVVQKNDAALQHSHFFICYSYVGPSDSVRTF